MPLSPKRAGHVAYSAAMFLVVSMVAGLLVAGLAVPVAAMAGVGGRAAERTVSELPEEFDAPPQAVKSKVLMGNGEVLAYFYDQDRTYVELNQIAPIMRQALLAIEDHRYYQHGALDVRGTMRALVNNLAGGSTQGGSSITQQYVKMVRVEQAMLAGNEKAVAEAQDSSGLDGYARKFEELRYAIALEQKYGKNEILERYLNIAYFGDGAYGVEAASQHYFNKPAKKLNTRQAAMLAGLVRNPDADNPVDNPEAAIKRRDVVINRMAELGVIGEKEAEQAKSKGFRQGAVQSSPNGCVSSKYPFLCNYTYNSLLQMESLGKTKQARINTINRGGLTIKTAIDPKTQDAALDAVTSYIGAKDPVIGTMTMIEPGTGLIIGMAQSRPEMGSKKGQTFYNYAAPPKLGGSPGGFQSGSTFKAVTIAAALAEGVSPAKTYNASSPLNLSGTTWRTCDGSVTIGDYKPKNSTGVNGVMSMRKAANYSVNTYFLQLERTIGLCPVVKMAEKLGIKLASGEDLSESDVAIAPSLTLGVANIAPSSMAEAYATFASGGIHCDPVIIDSIRNRHGKKIKPPSANCERVISKDVANGVNDILSGVMEAGATGYPARLSDGRPQAGKTGTTDDTQAVWFAGYTPELAGVASIAEDVTQPPFNKQSTKPPGGLDDFYLEDAGHYLQGSGGRDAGAGIWRPAMEKALEGVPPTQFDDYDNSDTTTNRMVPVPDISGLSIEAATKKLEAAGFSVVPTSRYDNDTAYGTFLGWSQYGGKAPKYSTIYAIYSAGISPAEQARRERAAEAAQRREEAAERRREQQEAAAERRREQQEAAAERRRQQQAAEAERQRQQEAAERRREQQEAAQRRQEQQQQQQNDDSGGSGDDDGGG